MFGYFFDLAYIACGTCGMSLSATERDRHVCDPERRARFEAFQLRKEVAGLERELAAFLESPAGRFALYYAERERRSRDR
jgi:hypothetical protein